MLLDAGRLRDGVHVLRDRAVRPRARPGAGEMVDQVRVVADDFGERVTNAVAMGQGEPFANYDATLGALRLMNSPDGLGIGARHLTVSTCGLASAIRRFAAEPEQFTLAVSLHSARQPTRDRLMPGVKGVSLGELREALVAYAEQTGRRPSLEYALIDGVNDTDAELEALVAYCKGMLVHVNLIPINPVAGTDFARGRDDRAAGFKDRLERAGDRVLDSRRAWRRHRRRVRTASAARSDQPLACGLRH